MRVTSSRLWPVALALLLACDLDTTNPNAPTDTEILTTREGVVALAIGLQARYGAGLDDFVYPGGLLTDELGATAAALQSYKDAEIGELSNTYDAVETTWRAQYLTVKTANDVIGAAPNVPLGDSTRSGVLTLAYLLKAAALGTLLQQFKEIPIDIQSPEPEFVDRATALAAVLSLLDSARAQFSTVRPGNEFNTSIRASRIDVRNTIFAYLARYHRVAGNDAEALRNADSVNLTVLSAMPFSTAVFNPLFDLSERTGYVRPLDALRTSAEAGDARGAFHETVSGEISAAGAPIDRFTQYRNAADPFPLYFPGEVMLIRAEALTNLGRLVEAAAAVNAVRTKCNTLPAGDPEACLAPLPAASLDTPAELRAEIYRQRRYELFATGLRWEDLRRTNQVGAGLPGNRCWLLYPNSERNTRGGVPDDPPQFSANCA